MLRYYKRLWSAFWKDFKTATREQVIGAVLAVSILLAQWYFGVIKRGEVSRNFWAIMWPYTLLAVAFLLVHLIKAPYRLDVERERTENTLSSEISNLRSTLERLSWPEDRPKLFIHGWGPIAREHLPTGALNWKDYSDKKGFYLSNEGSAALEINLETVNVATEAVAGECLSQLESKGKGFIPIFMVDQPRAFKWGLDNAFLLLWKERALKGDAQKVISLPIALKYRDFNGNWYRTCCDIHFTHVGGLITGGFSFGPPKQERSSGS